ncbi:DUF2785 domain-containing protein [Sphingopyxis sp.]|uniref:DUF2785 domain-containing protein n=1 Tax=Sphingopyxis sp. TaxID=1908224 RepID=UPI0035B4DF40
MKTLAASIFATADEVVIDSLISCFANPDPTIRDKAAFTLWSDGLRGNHLSPALLRHAAARLSAVLAAPDDEAGFYKPFAALALSEVARTDRVTSWMSDTERHKLAETGAAYLRDVTDYRGFTPDEGWRHGVAHGSDLALQLALNPRLARADAERLLAAIAAQVAPDASDASPFYHYGEPARLARPVLSLATRADIDDAAWAAWFGALHPDHGARWRDAYASDAGLAAIHNTTAFANAIHVAATEAPDPQIKRLAPLAADLLKALP